MKACVSSRTYTDLNNLNFSLCIWPELFFGKGTSVSWENKRSPLQQTVKDALHLFLFVVAISWTSRARSFKIWNEIRLTESKPHVFNLIIMCRLKPKSRFKGKMFLLLCSLKMPTTWQNKNRVKRSALESGAAVVLVLSREGEVKGDSAYLPGCVLRGSCAATLSTGRTVWLTCHCSRRRAFGASWRTAWVVAAGWSSSRWV